jgi:5-methyltetrahydrofolate--homocysteine methyltransferase
MTKMPLLEALQTRVLLGDGAMGTQLQQAGLEPGGWGDEWNLIHPERVAAVQRKYVEAGSDCLITNTFGSNRFVASRYGLENKIREVNRAGAEIARAVAGTQRYVLGDVGPFGGMLEPIGETSREEIVAAFEEQVRGLAEGGVDAIIIETMTALEEMECAVEAVRNVTNVPVIGSFAFDKLKNGGYKTMMGVSPEQAAGTLVKLHADVMACNCGTALDTSDYQTIIATLRAAGDAPIMAQPNAGMPELNDDVIIYRETPEMMAEAVWGLVRSGANIVGGCCGTTPDHIRLFRKEIDKL